MAVTRVSNSKDGRAAIRYVIEEASHKEDLSRVLASSGSNLDPRFAMLQMKAVWDSAGKNNGKSVQVYRLIQSFGLDELDPESPDDIEKANLLGLEMAKELYPDRQALIVTQADGVGGKLHNHVIVNAVSAIDGKSLRGKKTTHWKTVSDASDRVLGRHGMKPLVPDEKRPKSSMAETKIRDAGEYSWKEDLVGRIGDALYAPGVTDKDTFEKYMFDEHDVTVRFGKSNRVKYVFEDAGGNVQSAGVKALGAPCGMEDIQRAFDRNAKLAQENLERERLERQAEERERIAVQSEIIEVEKPVGFSFDFDAELAKIRPRQKDSGGSVKKSKIVEPDIMREVREEREVRQDAAKMDRLHGEALVINATVDDRRAQEAAVAAREEEKRKVEQERVLRAAESARKRAEVLEGVKRQEQLERAKKAREAAKGRLVREVFHGWESNYDVSESTLARFMQNEEKWMGTQYKNGITKVLEDFTVPEVYRRTKIQLAEEKRAERDGARKVTDQVAQADGPVV